MQVIETPNMGYLNPLGYQFWKNPVDGIVYAGTGQPDFGFDKADSYFFPVFDPATRSQNISKLKTAVLKSELI